MFDRIQDWLDTWLDTNLLPGETAEELAARCLKAAVTTGISEVELAAKYGELPTHFEGVILAPPPPLPPPAPPPVESVSASQAKIALFNAGLLADVEALVAAHPYEPVRIWYHSANQWEAAHPYVVAIGYELGLSAEQIQDLFDAAALQ